jgi:hypothetical protein
VKGADVAQAIGVHDRRIGRLDDEDFSAVLDMSSNLKLRALASGRANDLARTPSPAGAPSRPVCALLARRAGQECVHQVRRWLFCLTGCAQ